MNPFQFEGAKGHSALYITTSMNQIVTRAYEFIKEMIMCRRSLYCTISVRSVYA